MWEYIKMIDDLIREIKDSIQDVTNLIYLIDKGNIQHSWVRSRLLSHKNQLKYILKELENDEIIKIIGKSI